MHRIINAIKRRLKHYGLSIEYIPAADRKMVTLSPTEAPKGRVLISYIIEPFLLPKGSPIPNSHTHFWESIEITNAFLKRGYTVDIISYRNMEFVAKHDYVYFFGVRTNFELVTKRLNHDCVKICHMDTAHWITNNEATYNRMLAARERRGLISGRRLIESNSALECADLITVLGNQFTINSYRYGGIPMHRIRISTPEKYDWPEQRDYQKSRHRFLWFGSTGFVHKGLDLALEAVANIPEAHLTVCGPIDSDPKFIATYEKELYHTPNIDTIGWVDVAGDQFKDILTNTVSILFPSCSEGGAGSVISCMHGGLIPVVTYEASINIENFGVLIKNGSVSDVENAIREILALPNQQLEDRCRKAWQYARENHTQEIFSHDLDEFIDRELEA